MRFTIRDLLWLTVVVGIASAWLVDRTHQASVLSAIRELRGRGGCVIFGEQPPSGKGPWFVSANRIQPTVVAFGPRDFSSRHGSASVVMRRSRTVHDDIVPIVCRLSSVRMLDLGNTRVTDNGVRQLVVMKRLSSLWLNGTLITDDSVHSLEKLTHLKTLDISTTRITSDGYRKLQHTLNETSVRYD